MGNNNLDKNKLIELITLAQESNLKEFYYENKSLKLNFKFEAEIIYKSISDTKILKNEKIVNEVFEKIIIKSEYVARIKLVDSNNHFFVKVGDYVKKDAKIAEYEYLNVIIDLKAPCDGIIKELLVEHNHMIDFNKNLIVMDRL
ncbi:biotin/lipoyl-containing protein [Clostridium zeae]|nr:biotin/lipoyl-containing protein [Clostridium zeae]